MSSVLEDLRLTGQLSALDYHFALSMGRIAGEDGADVLLAAALLSQHVSRGQVCLDLPAFCREPSAWLGEDVVLPDIGGWLVNLRGSPLVSNGESKTPLVLSDRGLLYLHRYWNHERALAQQILARAEAKVAEVDEAALASSLERLFPSSASGEFDYQRFAALMAVRRAFCVVSGGPGTGKTYTVVKILALLIEQALATGSSIPHISLVAPTGKAAARLVDSIKKSKAGLDCADEVRDGIVERASTIHRCLGSMGWTSTGFRHHSGNRLVTDVVLVDEASMVNLGLMRRLVSAMPGHARLILLGDMDQLASVEAGSVLGDICQSGQKRVYSPALRDEVKALGGGDLPEDQVGASLPAISDCVVKLQKSYRFQGETGIAALARAINSGDSQGATEALDRYDDVLLVPPSPTGKLSAVLREAILAGYEPYLQPGEAAERLAKFDRFRILCARRTGPFGVEAVGEQVVVALRRAGLVPSGVENYDGRPIMITANTYELQIFNGDIGLVLPDPKSGQLRACFTGGDGELRMFAPSRLPHQESALAMSVHKSQGSEFDEVAIVLPEEPGQLLTRELIYTAVTRAKKRVVIHAHPAILRYAIEHPTERSSGLRAKLWGAPL